jgi:predicted GNAT family acetyltransferase
MKPTTKRIDWRSGRHPAAEARAEGLKITPICGYAAAWLARSQAFGDLVA